MRDSGFPSSAYKTGIPAQGREDRKTFESAPSQHFVYSKFFEHEKNNCIDSERIKQHGYEVVTSYNGSL